MYPFIMRRALSWDKTITKNRTATTPRVPKTRGRPYHPDKQACQTSKTRQNRWRPNHSNSTKTSAIIRGIVLSGDYHHSTHHTFCSFFPFYIPLPQFGYSLLGYSIRGFRAIVCNTDQVTIERKNMDHPRPWRSIILQIFTWNCVATPGKCT